MATANFFVVNKRHNSTLIPTSGSAVEVTLKNGTDLLHPVFLIEYGAVPTFTMIQFSGRYYFVDTYRSIRNNLWEISCSVDVLATYKANIKATTANVLYDTTANTELIDTRLTPISTPTIKVSNEVALNSYVSTTGSTIVTITGENSVGTYKLLDITKLSGLLPSISSAYDAFIEGEDPFDAINAAGKQIVGSGSVGENIRNALWIPFNVPGGTWTYPLKVGVYSTSVGGYILGDPLLMDHVAVDIPWQFSDWRNNSPYTKLYIFIPFVGTVELPVNELIGVEAFTVKTTLNKHTGELAIKIQSGSRIISKFSANTAMNVPLGGNVYTPLNAASGIIGAATSILSGNLLGVAGAMQSAITPSVINGGNIGGGTDLGNGTNIVCWTVCHNTNQLPTAVSAIMGTPTYKVKSLSALTGYVQTENFSISGSMTDEERQEINSLMDGGVYIE